MIYAKTLKPCEEFAVFHAACLRADQLCSGGLVHYSSQRQGAADALQIVVASVVEIRSGLGTKLSLPQSSHWDFKLTALSTWRMLSTFRRLHPSDDTKFAVPQNSIINCLPEWNFQFYCDLIRQNDWTEHFLQIASASRHTFGVRIFTEFLRDICTRVIDELNISILTDVFEYFFLLDNCYFCSDKKVFCSAENSGSILWSAIDNLLSYLLSALEQQQLAIDCRLILSLINVLAFVVGPGYSIVVNHNCLDAANPFSIFELQRDVETNVMQTEKNVADQLLEYELIKLPLVNVQIQKEFTDVVAVAGKLAKVTRYICLQTDLGKLSCLLTGQGEWSAKGTLRHFHPSVRSAMYREIFIHASKEIALSDFDSEQLDIQQLLEVMKPVIDSTAAYVCHYELKRCEPLQQFQRAVFVVNERLEGYESCCDLLLKTECLETGLSERWSECLINNAELFGSLTNGTTRLLVTFMKNRHLLHDDQADRLQKAICQVFANKSIEQQNEVLQNIYVTRSHPSDLCLPVDSEYLSSQLLTTLNRVTSDAADLQIIVKDVCLLALLQPTQIIDKLVECAVLNKGHTDCVIKIFRLVPALVCIHYAERQCLAVYSSLEKRLLTISHRQAQNFVNFCRLLIMPALENSKQIGVEDRRYSENSGTLKPLCSVSDYLNVLLFPNLSQLLDFVNVDVYLQRADVILPLLAVAVELFERLTWSELVLSEPIPLVFFLCQVIDICRSASLSGAVEVLHTKETAVDVLKNLVATTAKHRNSIPGASLSWLHHQLMSCHWLIKFYTLDLLTDLCPMTLMLSMSSFMEFSGTDYAFNGQNELLALAEFASVSEEALQMLSDDLLLEVISCRLHLYSGLVHVVSQAMTWSTPQEFTRVTRLVSRFLCLHRVLMDNSTSDSTGVIDMDNKQLDIDHINGAVGTSYLVTEAVVVLSELFNERIGDPHQFHMARCCVAAFKANLSECNVDESDSYHNAVFALIGCLLRAFDVFTSQVATETLSLLALELLTSLEQSYSEERHDVKLPKRLDPFERVTDALSEMSCVRTGLSNVVKKVDQMRSSNVQRLR